MSIRIDNTHVIRYEYVNYYLVPIKSLTANMAGEVFGKAGNRETSNDVPSRTYRKYRFIDRIQQDLNNNL